MCQRERCNERAYGSGQILAGLGGVWMQMSLHAYLLCELDNLGGPVCGTLPEKDDAWGFVIRGGQRRSTRTMVVD